MVTCITRAVKKNLISFRADNEEIGVSMRLSLDLGLHTDMAPYVQNGQMSSEEAQIRGVAFWGSFIVDQ